MDELSFIKKNLIKYRICKRKLLELIRFDSRLASLCLTTMYFIQYFVIKIVHGEFTALVVIGDIFRHTQFDWIRLQATKILKKVLLKYGSVRVGKEIYHIIGQNIDFKMEKKLRESIISYDKKAFDGRLIILSRPLDGKKGVILIKFSNYFKYILKIFDIKKLSEDYILVVEPSFCGYFDPDILCLLSTDIPIIIQALEPVDYQFIKDLQANLYPIRIGANFWVDDKTFYPINNTPKIYDIIMVAIWADFKRHYHLFESMARSSDKLKVCLVGKAWPKSINDIKDEARYFNVLDQITFFENISQSKINILLNSSKCLILLSKKEGFNKSLIEALYANIPIFILEGHNFGCHYSFINSKTGNFISSKKLPRFLEDLDELIEQEKFIPYAWVKDHISVKISIDKLIEILAVIEVERSIKINKDLYAKVNSPELNYYDRAIWNDMEPYYRNLYNYLNRF